jgi:hypothetical protein
MMDKLSVATKLAIHTSNYLAERDGEDPKESGWASYRSDDKADIVAEKMGEIDKLIEMGVIDPGVFETPDN